MKNLFRFKTAMVFAAFALFLMSFSGTTHTPDNLGVAESSRVEVCMSAEVAEVQTRARLVTYIYRWSRNAIRTQRASRSNENADASIAMVELDKSIN